MTDEINVKRMFECEHCHIRFEKYDEAVEHEKACSEKIEEKMEANAENETVKVKEETESKEPEEKNDEKEENDDYLNTDIEKEIDDANGKEDEEEIEVKEVKETKAEEEKEIEMLEEGAEEKIIEREEAIKQILETKEIKEEKIEAKEEKPEIKKDIIEEQAPQPPKEEKTKCTLCGLCKLSCPAYSVLLNEAVSPRGKAIMLKRDIPSKYIYLCTLCKACEEACVLNDIDITKRIVEFRKELVNLGIRTEANERMIDNIRKYGNSIGKIEPGKKVTLWCC